MVAPFSHFPKEYWLPTLDTLRNFFLMPTVEMLAVFQTVTGQL
jgi:hypothetical protein